MASQEGSVRPGSVSVRVAIRELHQRVKAAMPADVDPAPWHDVSPDLIALWSEGDEPGFVRRKKMEERSKLVMQQGLLSGALRAHFSDGREAGDVPGWAWVGAERNEHVWFEGRLPLDVFLPDEWQRWSCHSVYLDRAAFDAWADGQPLSELGGLPNLPTGHDADAKPEPILTRQPPNVPFISLSEAITWIAFGISLDCDKLDRAISSLAFDARDPQAALADAIAALAVRASGGQIAMRGKYMDGNSPDETKVLTELIDPVRLEDFAQFDILYDGLRYGSGLTWWNSNESVIDRAFSGGRSDAFRSVKVSRVDLLKEFPRRMPRTSTDEQTPVSDGFNRDDAATIAPWWTVNQALAWIPTRIASFVEYVGRLERRDEANERQRHIVHALADAQIAESDEGREFLDSANGSAPWPGATVLAHAGRALLKPILAGRVIPLARANGEGRKMEPHDFVGIGQREEGSDWLALDPQPVFASAEIIREFPLPTTERDVPGSLTTSTTKAENECREWLANEFGADPDKRRPKADFQAAALAKFPGRLSVRGFVRVWEAVAPQAGRSKPGRKS